MKIGIIGGGFYGCYLAYKLVQQDNRVVIFEKNKKILSEAAINNQYRLHRGFHYPRSNKTIMQTNLGARLFIKEFRRFVYFPKLNIYAVHKNSNISFRHYLKIYKKNKIVFKIINRKFFQKYFTQPNKIEGAIKVQEGVIKLNELYKFLKKKIKKVNLKTNTEVKKIDNIKKRVYFNNEYEDFDLIINCTFIDPNMGLKKDFFKVKYEIASMVHVKNFLNKNIALTLMDGSYGSLYPINDDILTLSSVKYTPLKKCEKLNQYKKIIKSKNFYKSINQNSKKIINHLNKFFIMPNNIKIKKITTSPKVKVMKDFQDQRLSMIKSDRGIVSILCGKLDAAPLVWKSLKKKL